jgi:hypothetical protein
MLDVDTRSSPLPTPSSVHDELLAVLSAQRNERGGWGYQPSKASRIEPTCWALMALGARGAADEAAYRFLLSCQRATGLLSDRADLPVNLAWSALALIAVSGAQASGVGDFRSRLLQALVDTKGLRLENSPIFRQNNQLQGWPWVPETFSWLEPTGWSLIALKRSPSADGTLKNSIASRIADGEAVLIDRACESGGWNYGNANAFGTDLPAHVPTTVVALLALQDKRDHPVVRRGLAFLEEHWPSEVSGTALGLSLLCLRLYERPTDGIAAALAGQWGRTRFLGNLAATAIASCALDPDPKALDPLELIG